MATEAQYDFFKELYDEERERYTALGTRANLYFTIISFLLGALLLKFEDLAKFLTAFQVTPEFFLWVALILTASLLCTLASIVVRKYEGIADPLVVVTEFDQGIPDDDDFRDSRIADLIVATERSSKQNDVVAFWLTVSAWITIAGVSLVFVALLGSAVARAAS